MRECDNSKIQTYKQQLPIVYGSYNNVCCWYITTDLANVAFLCMKLNSVVVVEMCGRCKVDTVTKECVNEQYN